ncbi:MAG: transcriptional repressor [Solobacterium sp.]|jgi:Fur family ferric uptake transcriptional regulator|nr:transcriptional repressor [Solobacterium sp.]
MTNRPIYKTKQREILLQYMKENTGRHITAAQVCDYVRAQGTSIGQATVYRQLERMVDEGILSKYMIDANTPACFEYVGENGHADAEACFHCKCEKCGKLIHMHCEELETIAEHVRKEHGFAIDPLRTVFYGICSDCAGGTQ